MSEWKPGDVAIWDHEDGCTDVIFRFLGGKDYDIPEWQTDTDGCGYPDPARLRPAAVIDPEDRNAVERLSRGLVGFDFDLAVEKLQAALREFADPTAPKPDEPTGLGAVVEDREGDIWLRDGMPGDRSQSGHWWNKTVAHEKNYDGVLRADWHAIAAIRVLSPGVTDGGAS